MCVSKYIKKVNSKIELDTTIKIGGKDFDILNKPYYISRTVEEGKSELFVFRYQDEAETKCELQCDDTFQLVYGAVTGRLYTLKLTVHNDHIKNEEWTKLANMVKELSHISEIVRSNLEFCLKIVVKIYQNNYEEIEQ